MRTNIVIDDDLLEEAFSVSRSRTKKDLIHEALRALIRLNKRKDNEPGINDAIDIKQLLARRAQSQPTGVASCGSVFRNPEGDYAARLIEQCGLKGRRIGGAVISEKHANFIINKDNATATDIESLIELAQKEVEARFGILLQPEVRIVGEFQSGEGDT